MAEHTGIAYAHHSVGFWRGCHKIGIGCSGCFGEREMLRYGHDPHVVVRAKPATFNAPLKWNEEAVRAGERHRVFVTPWSDFWIEEADAWREDALALIRDCMWLDFVSPSKRLDRAAEWLGGDALPPNFWPLASVSVQDDLEAVIPHLMSLKVSKRGLSYEPAIGPLTLHPLADWTWRTLSRYYGGGDFDPTGSQLERERNSSLVLKVDWIIAGCESASHTTPGRPAELDWFRRLRDECVRAGIPLYLKQVAVDGRLIHAPLLDGVQWQQILEVTP